MGATSLTGVGGGSSLKVTTDALAVWATGPQIILAGTTTADTIPASSPSAIGGTVNFPEPLVNAHTQYGVWLTTLNGGSAYVSDMDDEDGHFSEFSFITEAEGTVFYLVVNLGQRANFIQ